MVGRQWVLDESKFLSTEQAKKLVKAARARAKRAGGKGNGTARRDYLIVKLGLATGLRVSEMAGLNCGDVFVANGASSLIVRNGKGGKTRTVAFNRDLKEHLRRFLHWKSAMGEPTGDNAPFLLSSATGKALTTRSIQKAFKRCARRAGLSPHYSIHSLRHYAEIRIMPSELFCWAKTGRLAQRCPA